MEKMSKFAEMLIDMMGEKKLTYVVLAKNINCSISTISRWINNVSEPSQKNLISLSDYFNCSIDFLVGKKIEPIIIDLKLYSSFSERLKLLTKQKGKKLASVAADLRIDFNFLYRWADSTNTPNLGALILLSNYFGCSIDYLIGRNEL